MDDTAIAQYPVDVPVGPWIAFRSSKSQISGDWFLARKLLTGDGFSLFEQMRDLDGKLKLFETEAQARRAIAEAEGHPWFATDEEAEAAMEKASGGIER
jgi:hypothetical protein